MFDGIPDGVHFFEGHFIKIFALLQRFSLHFCKPVNELLIGSFQSIFRINAQKPCIIDQRKHEITKFIFYFISVAFCNRSV